MTLEARHAILDALQAVISVEHAKAVYGAAEKEYRGHFLEQAA